MNPPNASQCDRCLAAIDPTDLLTIALDVKLDGTHTNGVAYFHPECWYTVAADLLTVMERSRIEAAGLDRVPVIDPLDLLAERMRHTLADGSPWGGPTIDLELALAQVPPRAGAALRWHYSTIEELADAPPEDLHAIRHVGPETVGALRACITIYQAQRKARG